MMSDVTAGAAADGRAVGRRAAVRGRRGELGVGRDGGHGRARTASARRGRGGLAGADDRGGGGAWGGWVGHAVRRRVGLRAGRRARPTTAIEITPLGVGLVGRAAAVLVLPTVPARGGSRDRAGRTRSRARARWSCCSSRCSAGWPGPVTTSSPSTAATLGLDRGAGRRRPRRHHGPAARRLGDIGDLGGLLPDRIGGSRETRRRRVGFTVDTGAVAARAAPVWVLGVLVIALLASRRTPLPRGWDGVHRAGTSGRVRAGHGVAGGGRSPGCAAAAYAAIGDDHPKRIAGAALLGAPNGVWLGVPLGLFVPVGRPGDRRARQAAARPAGRAAADLAPTEPVTLGRLAELDGRVWLLAVAAAVMMLYAGVLAAVRTPVTGGTGCGRRRPRFAGRCALRLGVVTALGAAAAGVADGGVRGRLAVGARLRRVRRRDRAARASGHGAAARVPCGVRVRVAVGALLAYAGGSGAGGPGARRLARGGDGPAPVDGGTPAPGPYTPGAAVPAAERRTTNPYLRAREPRRSREPIGAPSGARPSDVVPARRPVTGRQAPPPAAAEPAAAGRGVPVRRPRPPPGDGAAAPGLARRRRATGARTPGWSAPSAERPDRLSGTRRSGIAVTRCPVRGTDLRARAGGPIRWRPP